MKIRVHEILILSTNETIKEFEVRDSYHRDGKHYVEVYDSFDNTVEKIEMEDDG